MISHSQASQKQEWWKLLNDVGYGVHTVIGEPLYLQAFQEAIRPWGQEYEKHEADQRRLTAADVCLRAISLLYGFHYPPILNRRENRMPTRLAEQYIAAIRQRRHAIRKRISEIPCESLEYETVWNELRDQTANILIVKVQLKALRENRLASKVILAPPDWRKCFSEEVLKAKDCQCPDFDAFTVKITPHPADTLWPDPQGKVPTLSSDDEQRARRFAILAVIHDSMVPESPKITKDVWPESLLKQVWRHFEWNASAARPEPRFIQAAFEDVQRELPPAQKSDRQNDVDELHESSSSDQTSNVREELSKEQQGLAVLAKYPGWSDKKIAKVVGVHPKSVYRWHIFMRAREVQKAERRNKYSPGHTDTRTGNLDAAEVPDESDNQD